MSVCRFLVKKYRIFGKVSICRFWRKNIEFPKKNVCFFVFWWKNIEFSGNTIDLDRFNAVQDVQKRPGESVWCLFQVLSYCYALPAQPKPTDRLEERDRYRCRYRSTQ